MEATQTWNPHARGYRSGRRRDRAHHHATCHGHDGHDAASRFRPTRRKESACIRQIRLSQDHVERGTSRAERRDTIKYQFERPGTFELPDVSLVWWDPQAEQAPTDDAAGGDDQRRRDPANQRRCGFRRRGHLPAIWPLVLLAITAAAGSFAVKPVRRILAEMASTTPRSRVPVRAAVAVGMSSQRPVCRLRGLRAMDAGSCLRMNRDRDLEELPRTAAT